MPARRDTICSTAARPTDGDVIRLPALARRSKAIAARRREGLLRGADRRRTSPRPCRPRAALARGGGFRAPSRRGGRRRSSTNYRGLDVVELPPNGQGLTALVLLNILERFDLAALDPLGAERLHLALEAARLAFARARRAYRRSRLHARAGRRSCSTRASRRSLPAASIRTSACRCRSAPTPGSDTVYLTVVDRDRMAVSLINSLYSAFGTGICTEKTGIMLHNRGAGFVLDPGHPERDRPGQAADAHHHSGAGDARRPLRDAVRRDGRALPADGPRATGHQHGRLRDGRAGGDRRAARVLSRARHAWSSAACRTRRSRACRRAATTIVVRAPRRWAARQAIVIDWERGVLIGGSDPRKDGCALGY